MPYSEEIIAGTVLVAVVSYYLYITPKNRKEKLNLLIEYRRVQNQSLEVQDTISRYILENDAYNETLLNNTITMGAYLKQLQYNHSVFLSEDMYRKIRNSNSSRLRKKAEAIIKTEKLKLKNISEQISVLQNKALY
jgi:archaellum biogenesis ATPase FlaH